MIEKKVILISFLMISVAKTIYTILYMPQNSLLQIGSFIALFCYSVLTYYAMKQAGIAYVIMSIVILTSGIGSLLLAIRISYTQSLFKLISFLIAVFFIYGGIRLLILRHNRSEPVAH